MDNESARLLTSPPASAHASVSSATSPLASPLHTLLTIFLNCDPTSTQCHKRLSTDLLTVFLLASLLVMARLKFSDTIAPALAKWIKIPPGRIRMAKFTEQSWLLLCHTLSLCGGGWLLYRTKYAKAVLGSREGLQWLWRDYPADHKFLAPEFKLFYLLELSYWIHLAVSLVIEQRARNAYEQLRKSSPQGAKLPIAQPPGRSDFAALAVHHVVTIALIATSYWIHFTKFGHVVMVLLDVADVLLPLAKIFRYAFLQLPCDATFALFAVSWVITRHVSLPLLTLSIYRDPFIYIPMHARHWDPWIQESFWSYNVWYVFLALFAALQGLLLYWGYMIVRVIVKVVRGGPVEDVRSDEESEGTVSGDVSAEKMNGFGGNGVVGGKGGLAEGQQRKKSMVKRRGGRGAKQDGEAKRPAGAV
ncbi:sphingosine N-acyltransferase lag1 [Borealophlyctis nickersoniae]|nr:sphingosine N-acyltransferase lag1 [Borealophlyctis nickersoniae]